MRFPFAAIGEAEASATQAKGLAEGEAVRAKGMAAAEAIKARAEALSENQDAVIGQQLAEQWPAIVEAAAKPFGDVDQMILLNGAQGLSDVLAQALSQGVTGLQMARNLLSGCEQLRRRQQRQWNQRPRRQWRQWPVPRPACRHPSSRQGRREQLISAAAAADRVRSSCPQDRSAAFPARRTDSPANSPSAKIDRSTIFWVRWGRCTQPLLDGSCS